MKKSTGESIIKLPDPTSAITYNAANQMLTFNEESLSYDLNGNLVQKGATTYQWDARNRLIGISGPDMQAGFKYDALGRRIEKTINGKTTNYLYDGADIVQEIEGGMVSANYVRTLNIDEPLARIKSDGTVRYYQQDALGSVVALTDEKGIVKTAYTYDPFGNVNISGESSDNPFQFAGRENDGDGHLYERYRTYHLELQRYISEDPIGFNGGDVNFYVRVWNDPINWKDPLGLQPLTPQQGKLIADVARTWHAPYVRGGKTRAGADCSGAVCGIYNEAGFPYPYSPTATFSENPYFTPVSTPQVGDVGLFKGHMAIYVNDTYGHPTGDKVILSLSRLLQQRLRKTDVIGRYGGEEFAAVLLDVDPQAAKSKFDEIRESFSGIKHQSGETEFHATFSCGIASFPHFGNAKAVTNAADNALYEAKRSGRNKVVSASEGGAVNL